MHIVAQDIMPFNPPPSDPREQAVADPYPQTPKTLARALARAAQERADYDAIRGRTLTVICGWCSDKDEKTAAAEARGEDVSHTICPPCIKRLDEEYQRTVEGKLELTALVEEFGGHVVKRWLTNITAMLEKADL